MYANRRTVGLGERTTEISGLIGQAGSYEQGISYEDLHEGRLWGAHIEQALVDWAFPFTTNMMWNFWYVGDIDYDDREWRLQLVGITSRLKGKRGEMFSRLCQNELGVMNAFLGSGTPTASACPVSMAYPNKVSDAVVEASPAPTKRVVYVKKIGASSGFGSPSHGGLSVTSSGAYTINYFQHGYVEIQRSIGGTTNPLQGLQERIFQDERIDAEIRKLTFLRPLPRLLVAGDTMHVFAGCDKHWETCKLKFGALNGIGGNYSGGFRGFPEIPGTDRAIRYPPAS